MQLSRTGKKWISVIVAIRPVFPDLFTYVIASMGSSEKKLGINTTSVVLEMGQISQGFISNTTRVTATHAALC